MEILKRFLITLLIVSKTKTENVSKTSEAELSKNVTFVYSHSNTLSKKSPKIVGTIVMPHKESTVFVVYPQEIFDSTTETNKIFPTTKVDNLVSTTTYTQEDYFTTTGLTKELQLAESNTNSLLKAHIFEETLKSFKNMTLKIPHTLNPFAENYTENFIVFAPEIVTKFDADKNDSAKDKYENQIVMKRREAFNKTFLPKIRIKMKNTKNNLVISTFKPILPIFKNFTKSFDLNLEENTKSRKNNTKIANSQSLKNTRDFLLKQSTKSKKFISTLMKKNKNRISITNLNKFDEDITTKSSVTLKSLINNQTYSTTVNDIILETTTLPSVTIPNFEEVTTVSQEESLDQDIVTEWRSLRIKKMSNTSKRPYRGHKKFLTSNIMRVNSEVPLKK